MAYTAKTVKQLRSESGSLLKKVADELSNIETQIDTIDALAEAKILVGNAAGAATDVDMSGDVTIIADGTTAIGADKVANTMLENMTRGTVKVGGTSDAPTNLSAKATGNILVGDDTDLKSVAMSGDISIIADGTTTIGVDKVANTMLENITRGSVKVGGTDDAPTDLAAKTTGQILVGDGTDIASVAISGDVDISANGTMTIQADSVENSMLANITRGSVKVGGASDTPTDLAAKTSGQILVGDGTDVASVAVSGDLDLSANGTMTIGSDKVASSMAEPTFIKVVSGALSADVSGNFAFAWQNPEDAKVLVHRVIVDITTAGGEVGAKLDVGVAPNATTAANDIFDDIDANATAVLDHLLESGAGLGGVHKVDENAGTNDYITGAILVKDASSLAGYYYVMYTEVAG
jgi:hypothetical protein